MYFLPRTKAYYLDGPSLLSNILYGWSLGHNEVGKFVTTFLWTTDSAMGGNGGDLRLYFFGKRDIILFLATNTLFF